MKCPMKRDEGRHRPVLHRPSAHYPSTPWEDEGAAPAQKASVPPSVIRHLRGGEMLGRFCWSTAVSDEGCLFAVDGVRRET